MAVRNSFERFVPSAVAVFGLVTGSTTQPTISNQSGDLTADQSNVSISRTSAGIYVISITNFRGQRISSPRTNVDLQPTTPGDTAVPSTVAYIPGTDTLQVTVTNVNVSGTAVDDGYYFNIYAF